MPANKISRIVVPRNSIDGGPVVCMVGSSQLISEMQIAVIHDDYPNSVTSKQIEWFSDGISKGQPGMPR